MHVCKARIVHWLFFLLALLGFVGDVLALCNCFCPNYFGALVWQYQCKSPLSFFFSLTAVRWLHSMTRQPYL